MLANKTIINNKDVLTKMDEIKGKLKIEFTQVKAYCGIKGNEETDKLAVRAKKKGALRF